MAAGNVPNAAGGSVDTGQESAAGLNMGRVGSG